MEHPDIAMIEAYASRSLAVPELLEVAGHVAVCEECRARLQAIAFSLPASRDLESMLGDDPTLHLSDEEMAAEAESVGAGKPSTLSAEASEHLAGCAGCLEELTEVRRFYTPVVAIDRKKPATRAPRLVLWTLAAAAAIVLAVTLPRLLRPHPGVEAPLVAEVRDGGGVLGVTAEGKLRGADAVPASDAALLAQVLGSHRLPAASVPMPAAVAPEQLRSEQSVAAMFDVVTPREERVMAMPVFRWQAAAGATSYQVEIYDADFRRVAQSPRLKATEWTPAAPLRAGEEYRWSVTAQTPHGGVQAPAPPAKEASFAVADAATLASIDAAKQQTPNGHLLLASIYARAGMASYARAELQALGMENPGSPLVEQLLQSLPSAQFSPSNTKPAQ